MQLVLELGSLVGWLIYETGREVMRINMDLSYLTDLLPILARMRFTPFTILAKILAIKSISILPKLSTSESKATKTKKQQSLAIHRSHPVQNHSSYNTETFVKQTAKIKDMKQSN